MRVNNTKLQTFGNNRVLIRPSLLTHESPALPIVTKVSRTIENSVLGDSLFMFSAAKGKLQLSVVRTIPQLRGQMLDKKNPTTMITGAIPINTVSEKSIWGLIEGINNKFNEVFSQSSVVLSKMPMKKPPTIYVLA